MSKITQRLLDAHQNSPQRVCGSSIFADAAAHIQALSAEGERLRNIASDLQSLCDKQALSLVNERAEVERLTKERDAAIMEVSRQAAARGRAEGSLEASETAGVVEGWRARAEAAEACVKSLLKILAYPYPLLHAPSETRPTSLLVEINEAIDREKGNG